MDVTEAEDIKKRWQKYTELFKKELHDDLLTMIFYLVPDILECKVKGTLGTITTNKASRGPPGATLANAGTDTPLCHEWTTLRRSHLLPRDHVPTAGASSRHSGLPAFPAEVSSPPPTPFPKNHIIKIHYLHTSS